MCSSAAVVVCVGVFDWPSGWARCEWRWPYQWGRLEGAPCWSNSATVRRATKGRRVRWEVTDMMPPPHLRYGRGDATDDSLVVGSPQPQAAVSVTTRMLQKWSQFINHIVLCISCIMYYCIILSVVLWLGSSCFGNVLLKEPIGMLLSSWLCLLPGLIYNACQFELADILMLENVKGINILMVVYILRYQNSCWLMFACLMILANT